MDDLSDLGICKRIALIEGLDVNRFMGVYILSEKYNEAVNESHSNSYSFDVNKYAYNPLVDDALCFQLMVKYKVVMDWERKGYMAVIRHLKGFPPFGHGDTPNKAICLAIIEAHKENSQ